MPTGTSSRLLSQAFGVVVACRNRLYDAGVLPVRHLRRPVISVGNLSVGGTGKTPTVAYLCQLLSGHGFHPAVLSRGYRGKAESGTALVANGAQILSSVAEAGDEPIMLARQLPGTVIAVGKRRWRSAALVEGSCPSDSRVFVLDDGFQHRRLSRDLDLVVLDATASPLQDALLPAGRLREPFTALGRAHAVLINRCHLALKHVKSIEDRVRAIHESLPVFRFGSEYLGYRRLGDGVEAATEDLARRPVVAVAALGNPGQFLSDLGRAGVKVVNEFLFPDHHPFTQAEIDTILDRAGRLGAEAVITTEKDAVRLGSLTLGSLPFWSFRTRPVPLDTSGFSDWLLGRLSGLARGGPREDGVG